jgi:hypothetical protein
LAEPCPFPLPVWNALDRFFWQTIEYFMAIFKTITLHYHEPNDASALRVAAAAWLHGCMAA